jgi:hypothetical protein
MLTTEPVLIHVQKDGSETNTPESVCLVTYQTVSLVLLTNLASNVKLVTTYGTEFVS